MIKGYDGRSMTGRLRRTAAEISGQSCHSLRLLLLAVFLSLAANLPAIGQENPRPVLPTPPAAEEEPEEDRPGLPYSVTISGLEESPLASPVAAASQLVRLVNSPPPTRRGLQRRAEDDVERILDILFAVGRFGATAKLDIDYSTTPVSVHIAVTQGNVYRLDRVRVRVTQPRSPAIGEAIDLVALGVAPGTPAISGHISDAAPQIVRLFQERGYAFAESVRQEALVRDADQLVDVIYWIQPGPLVHFGETSITGNVGLDSQYIRNRIQWRPGERYDIRLVNETRRKLGFGGLFETVAIAPDEGQAAGPPPAPPTVETAGSAPSSDAETVNMEVQVEEGPTRFVGAGISWNSEDGPGANAFWGHRNVFGGAERFRIGALYIEREREIRAEFTKPDVFQPELEWKSELALVERNYDAYESRQGIFETGFEKPLGEYLRLGLGIHAERAWVEEEGQRSYYTLIGLPLTAELDSTDNTLNPTQGIRVYAKFMPASEMHGRDQFLTFAEGAASGYLPVVKDHLVLAGRSRAGMVFGASTLSLPATLRYYAGGGGSVRAFGFQKIGPLNANNDPTGGNSVIEFSGEARFRFLENYGVTLFADGASVSDNTIPTLDGFQWGPGIGLRYYTPIGPIRLDVAVPIDPRKDVDAAYQIYFAIGQSF